MSIRTFLCCAAACCWAGVFAATKVWTGGGADDNLSTPANWADGAAPATGDCLVFMGERRTSPVNDFDPAAISFKGIVFSNDCAACSAAFTVSGNELVLTGANASDFSQTHAGYFAILVANVANANASITDVIACDVRIPGGARIGNWNASRHHLTFTGTVSGSGTLASYDQNHGNLVFEGPVKGFSTVSRPNGSNGLVWLKSAENEFSTASPSLHAAEGELRIDSLAAAGGAGVRISLGQNAWNTSATFAMNAQADAVIDGNLTGDGPDSDKAYAYFQNAVAGTTLTLNGDLTTRTAGGGNGKGDGTCVAFGGAGDVAYTGKILTPSTWLEKRGSGTWTIRPESTTSATGGVSVTAGTLVMDADYSAMGKGVTVSSGAALSGTGAVASIAFKAGAILKVATDAAGRIAPLTVNGAVSCAGAVTVSAGAGVGSFAAGTRVVVLKAGGVDGAGLFVPDSSWPSSARFLEEDGNLVLSVPTASLVWKGDAQNNVWDASTANWKGGMTYSDGALVQFDDTADEGTADVVLSADARPDRVIVRGDRDYAFSGGGLFGDADLLKTGGASTLVLANENAYTGPTTVESGALRLEGALKDTAVVVREGAAFTNAPKGTLAGASSFTFIGSAFELCGTNDFTGDAVLTSLSQGKETEWCVIRGARALGRGALELRSGYFHFMDLKEPFEAGRLLRSGSSGHVKVEFRVATSGWPGDVELAGNRELQLDLSSGGEWAIGNPAGGTVVRVADGNSGGQIYLRGSGDYRFYSRIDFGDKMKFTKTDANTVHFYASGSTWSKMDVGTGTIVCHATNALACAPLTLGQAYRNVKFTVVLDMNGHDQTLSKLLMSNIDNDETTMTVKSDEPATLTITNATDFVTQRPGAKVEGKVTLRKQGEGSWTIAMANASEGDFIVEGGVLTLAADDVLPVSGDSRLVVCGDGRVAAADGVNATVAWLVRDGGTTCSAGVYGGEGCTVKGAMIRPDLFAPGGGTVTVRRGGGTVIIMR